MSTRIEVTMVTVPVVDFKTVCVESCRYLPAGKSWCNLFCCKLHRTVCYTERCRECLTIEEKLRGGL